MAVFLFIFHTVCDVNMIDYEYFCTNLIITIDIYKNDETDDACRGKI